MVTAKQLYGTYPHQQMRAYLKQEYQQDDPKQHAARLSALVKRWLYNHEQSGGRGEVDVNGVPLNIDESFTWANTPEGHAFWHRIHNVVFKHEDAGVKVKGVKVKEAPRKKVGWWA